jgi:predicted GNAT superfamily acetyltransferase
VFGFSETELVSPLILKLIARDNPPLGILIGVFECLDQVEELIGLIIGFATFDGNSVYAAAGGLLQEYQDGLLGFKMILKMRDAAMSRGLTAMYGVHEPIDSSLSRLYYGGLGYSGFKYNIDVGNDSIPSDKLLYKWVFDSPQTREKLAGRGKRKLEETKDTCPVVSVDDWPDAAEVLMPLPPDFIRLKIDDPSAAARIRLESRAILNEYINKRKYVIADCVTGKVSGERKSFYVLARP